MRLVLEYFGYCLLGLGLLSLLGKSLLWLGVLSDISIVSVLGGALLVPSVLVGYAFYQAGIEQPLLETGSHFPVFTLLGLFLLFVVPGVAAILWAKAGRNRNAA